MAKKELKEKVNLTEDLTTKKVEEAQPETTKKVDEAPKKIKINGFTFGTGRRKTSIARVAIKKGTFEVVINDMTLEKYFTVEKLRARALSPLKEVDREKDFSISIKISGGGLYSQADSVAHGLSHALIAYDETLRPTLSRAGLLTRDPRAKERRKYGHAGKARKMKQSPKR